MTKFYGQVTGWGAYTPERIVTNYDLETMFETSHDWIVQRTGIHERRWAHESETCATMSRHAAQEAIDKAGLAVNDIDFILVATTTPDFHTPSIANQLQSLLGAEDTPALMINSGCSGFVYGLSVAHQFIETGAYKNILLVGVEFLSRFVDPNDRATAVLFGDAAAAVVLQATTEPCGLKSFVLGSDGGSGHSLMFPATTDLAPVLFHQDVKSDYIRFNGREIFKFAARVVGRSCIEALYKAQAGLDDIDWIVPHQANLRILQYAAKEMSIPIERFYINIEKYANTSSASIPLALYEGLENGQIKRDDTLLLAAFGAGLSWGSAVFQLAPTVTPTAEATAALPVAAD